MSHKCVGPVCQHFDHAVGFDEADRRLHRAEQLLASLVLAIEEPDFFGTPRWQPEDVTERIAIVKSFLGWI